MNKITQFCLVKKFHVVVLISFCVTHFGEVATTEDTSNNDEFDYNEDSQERLRAHYALDYEKATNLSIWEYNLSEQFIHYLYFISDMPSEDSEKDPCWMEVERYVEEFEKDKFAVHATDPALDLGRIPDNPLLLYRMIRRNVVSLENLKNVCSENPQIIDIIDGMLTPEVPPPTLDDLNDALLGVLRIQYVYGYNATSELRVGTFGESRTRARLNFLDCLALGEYATEKGAHILAYQWLLSANLSLAEESDKMGVADASTDALNQSWKTLLERSPYNKMERMRRVWGDARQISWSATPKLFHRFDEYATCRGETLGEIDFKNLGDTCYLHWTEHPYFYINPLKIEILFHDPPVYRFHQFIGENTMEYIKRTAATSLARSGVVSVSQKSTIYSNYRTSLTTWIYDDSSYYPGPELTGLNKRIEFLTNLHVLKPGSSHALQVVSYTSLGAHYDFHDDALESEVLIRESGDRIATFFMFFSDVPLGGYTAFPKLNIYAKPIKGSAIIWFSLYKNGKADTRNTHGGCPVVLGRKLGANKWILQYENMFRYQCSIYPDY